MTAAVAIDTPTPEPHFVLPALLPPNGWGPQAWAGDEAIGIRPFPLETLLVAHQTATAQHFDQRRPADRIGRIADFSAGSQWQRQKMLDRSRGREVSMGGLLGINGEMGKDPDGDFKLVDAKTEPQRRVFTKGKGFKGKGKGKPAAVAVAGAIHYDPRSPPPDTLPGKGRGKGAMPGKGGKDSKGKGKGKGFGKGRLTLKMFKDWSVQSRPDWELVREIQQAQLAKLSMDSRHIIFEDIHWCGKLFKYDKTADRHPYLRSEKPLQKVDNLTFYNPTACDDQVIQEVLEKKQANVGATDHVLACLMASSRANYSFDIIVTRVGDTIIFDKRDGSLIDQLSVNETSMEPPSAEDLKALNSPEHLSEEAMRINQQFCQQMLDKNSEMPLPGGGSPFEQSELGEVAAAAAYRYRRVTLPSSDSSAPPIVMVVRTEVDAELCKDGLPEEDLENKTFCSIRALNEYDPKQGLSLRKGLESQRGAVLAQELKNNAFKMARWTACAMMSGSEVMKLGFVSRKEPKDPNKHVLLSVQTYQVDDVARQIGISQNHIWGVVRAIVEECQKSDHDKHILVKDPLKPIVRLYQIPFDSFEDDQDDEEEEEDEDQ